MGGRAGTSPKVDFDVSLVHSVERTGFAGAWGVVANTVVNSRQDIKEKRLRSSSAYVGGVDVLQLPLATVMLAVCIRENGWRPAAPTLDSPRASSFGAWPPVFELPRIHPQHHDPTATLFCTELQLLHHRSVEHSSTPQWRHSNRARYPCHNTAGGRLVFQRG
ncbi:hypothetical protein P171DRAFT_114113 [Karstenula rhodostoma CBS 690.94]|uniref:Uncharacterized protein n=1 Tax=Karstenula rhodostoma CBS 690.94 TaxID=1392251 RepID=A0A9P4P9G6_9PLEO|nr:hypothetical protein P171DRAFT_114113 [Karstenula rhodostoma CBS 690.94]